MANLDSRWQIPASYDPDLDFGGHVLRQRGTPTTPALNLLSYVALEQQLATLGAGSLLAWQLHADEDDSVGTTVTALLEDPGTDRLVCAHIMQLVADSAQRAGEVARLAWQGPLERETDKVSAGLMLAASVLATSADKAKAFLPKIEPGLGHATPEQRAVFALIRAALDPAAIGEAYQQFAGLEDQALQHFGIAQCALVAYQHESAGGRDPNLLRAYLEHAIYRYDIGRRESWAARLITYALLPLLANTVRAGDDELASWLARAAAFATGADSLPELQGVFRYARKLGFEGTVTTLEAGDPPTFVRVGPARQSSPVIATPASAAAAPAEIPAETPPPAKAKGGRKKKAKS